MSSLERLFRPDIPEGYDSSLQEGRISGWVPGIVVDNDDPRKWGRVRVECELIQANVSLPNDDDGWLWVLEEFTVNSAPGGSHRLLPNGTLVALIPMMGDPTKMLVIGCIPNSVDAPSPEFDRSKQKHGSLSPGNVLKVKNDEEASSLTLYPHGVLQGISKEGDITYQTAQEARFQLKADGTTRLENPNAFLHQKPDGEVVIANKEKARSVLKPDGTIEIVSAQSSALKLGKNETRLESPLGDISKTLKEVKETLTGHLGKAQEYLKQISELGAKLGLGDATAFLGKAQELLGQVNAGIGQNLDQGLAALDKLKNTTVSEMGGLLLPQAKEFLQSGLAQAVGDIEKTLQEFQQGTGANAIAQKIMGILPPELAKQVNVSQIENLIAPLQHDANIQLQAVLSEVMPGGFASIQNVLGLRLQNAIAAIDTALREPIVVPDDAEDPEAEALRLREEKFLRFKQAVPKDLNLSNSQLLEVFSAGAIDPDTGLKGLLGYASTGLASQAASALQQSKPLVELARPLEQMNGLLLGGVNTPESQSLLGSLMGQVNQGLGKNIFNLASPNLAGEATTQMPTALKSFGTDCWGSLGSSLKTVNPVVNAVPPESKGSVITVANTFAEMKASSTGIGGTARVDGGTAELSGPGGVNRVFANAGGAGVSTPWGSFGLGSGGGGFFGLGQLALRVLDAQSGGSNGIRFDPQTGVSLSGFAPGNWDWQNQQNEWENETARVKVDGYNVRIQSLGVNQVVQHEITVTPEGIFLDGIEMLYWITYLRGLDGRFAAFQASMDAFESRLGAIEPPGTP